MQIYLFQSCRYIFQSWRCLFSYTDVCHVDLFCSCGVGWRAPLIKQSKSAGYQLTRNSVGSELEIECRKRNYWFTAKQMVSLEMGVHKMRIGINHCIKTSVFFVCWIMGIFSRNENEMNEKQWKSTKNNLTSLHCVLLENNPLLKTMDNTVIGV